MIPVLAAAALAGAPRLAAAAPACTVALTGGLSFGVYDVYSPTPLTATARLRLTCPKGQTPQITVSAGNSGTFAWRELRSAEDRLRYNVYLDPAMTVVWGDGADGSVPWSGSGNAQLTLYGRVPSGQDVSVGDYGDVIVVTVFL